MHERALFADLIREIEETAREDAAKRVVAINVHVGPMSHLTPEHFVEHFADAARGTIAEGATCNVGTIDPRDPLAQSIVLESIELEV